MCGLACSGCNSDDYDLYSHISLSFSQDPNWLLKLITNLQNPVHVSASCWPKTEQELFCSSFPSEGWVFLPRTPPNRSFSNTRLRVVEKGGWLSQKQKECLRCRCSSFGQCKYLGGKCYIMLKAFLKSMVANGLPFLCLPFPPVFSLPWPTSLFLCWQQCSILSIRQFLNPWR